MENSEQKKEKKNKYKGAVIALAITSGVLGATTIGLGIASGIYISQTAKMQTKLENVFKKNMFDLAESVNNAEIKLSKALSSIDGDYQKKMLTEVVKNMQLAENSISSLPITQNSLAESVRFINQLGGYSTIAVEKLAQEGSFAEEEKQNLEELHTALVNFKDNLNEYISKVQEGYSIVDESIKLENDGNAFTIKISTIKEPSVDYPTMIYDGPFSDSENDYVVRGLKGDLVTTSEAENSVVKCFKNIEDINYDGEINSNFQTFDYNLKTSDGHDIFVQVSKIGGHILTVSGYNQNQKENTINIDDGEKLAIEFAEKNGIENSKVVWRDCVDAEAYYNIAPVQNGIILYPDLVKVKIDLSTGTVIGYDATSYFINHTDRNLEGEVKSEEVAKEFLPDDFEFEKGILVLAPLDYSREVVCYEFKSEKNGETYYFYINAVSGKTENILKVIKTDSGTKLM